MAEVFAEYPTPIRAPDGRTYRARIWGAEAQDGTTNWHGWIEFLPDEGPGGEPLRTGYETTQPNRVSAVYWARSLTSVYLHGALERALNPSPNPFSLYRAGESGLRAHFGRLSRERLIQIFTEYSLNEEDIEQLQKLSIPSLIEQIVRAVQTRLEPAAGVPLRAIKDDKTYFELLEHLIGGVSVRQEDTPSADPQPPATTDLKRPASEKPHPSELISEEPPTDKG